jgi:hypothetical protein
MNTMIEDRGSEYAARWPAAHTRRIGLGREWAATALKDIGALAPEREHAVRTALLSDELVPEVAALTPQQAKAVIARLHEIKRAITESRKTNCYYCGVDLLGGQCPSCGGQD